MITGPAFKTRILLLGPERRAISGVSTHLNQLFGSRISDEFELQHFMVGSEGRQETIVDKLRRILLSPFMLAARILWTRAEIVHINTSINRKAFSRDTVYLAVARVLRRKVVFQIHGGTLPQNLYNTAFAQNQVVRRVLRAADVVVLLSKEELEEYSRFIPGAKLQIIANGIAVDQQAEIPERETNHPLRLIYFGRLVPTKGVAECIAVAYLLRDAGREFKLTIAGSGPQEQALKAEATTLIRENFVEFVGAQFGEAKGKLWKENDVFVFPTHTEGLPYSLLESMAAGAVPITTRVGAQPDVVEDGVHGLFVPVSDPHALFDAIVKLDDDRGLLLAMSQRSMRRIRTYYSVERLSADFLQLYQSLAQADKDYLRVHGQR